MLTVMRIVRWDPRRDGRVSEAALLRKVQQVGYQVSSCEWPSGTVVSHAYARERVDAVVTGLVRVTVDGESAILTSGDMVYVPRGSVRQVEVVGPGNARCLDGISD